MIVFDQPGTTRDSIYTDFERGARRYTLIDTAGLRRRGRVTEGVERFSMVKTMQAIEDANVVILVLDARQDVSEQDAHIAGYVLEAGRALVIAVNKWERLPAEERELIKRALVRKLNFLSFARLHFISALTGEGISSLFRSVDEAYAAAMARLATPRLSRALAQAVAQQPPPRSGANRPKLRYAHQGGMNPPRIIIHGNQLDRVPEAYRRFLERFFRDAFQLHGTPLQVEFRSGSNPYARRRALRR
jgi:GTP-binding protein